MGAIIYVSKSKRMMIQGHKINLPVKMRIMIKGCGAVLDNK